MRRLPSEAQRLLDAARTAAGPTAAQRARADAAARARFARYGVGDVPPPLPEAAKPSYGATAGGAIKLGAAVVAGVTAVVLGLYAVRQRAEPARGTAAPSAAAVAVPPAPPAPVVVEASAPARAAVATTQVAPEPSTEMRQVSRPRRVALATDEALRAELRLITEAHELVQGERFDDALRVLAQHGRRFPTGVLRAERDGLRVLSLCGLGASERALRERAHYLRAAPQSPLAPRVRAACDGAVDSR